MTEIVGIKSAARYFAEHVRARRGRVLPCGIGARLRSAHGGRRRASWPISAQPCFAGHLAWQVVTMDRDDGARALIVVFAPIGMTG